MKAKTMLGLIACASACVSLSAFANTNADWFSVAPSGSSVNPDCCTVTTNGQTVAEAVDGKLLIGDDVALAVAPQTAQTGLARRDDVVEIIASAELTPNDVSDLSGTVDGAKAGFAVGVDNNVTNFYGYAYNTNSSAYGWFKLNGSPSGTGDTTFKMVLDYRTVKRAVQFYVIDGETTNELVAVDNDVALGLPDTATALAYLSAFGSGSVSALDANYEIAISEYSGVKYGSVSEAMDAAGSENYNAIAVVDETGSSAGGTGDADNGLQKWQCAALGIGETAQVGLTKSDRQNSGKITLAVVGVNAEEGVDVKYSITKDGVDENQEYDADNIQIPMGDAAGSHTYEIVPKITTK